METTKAYLRRLRENYFASYCQGRGIDIGAGNDPLKFEGAGEIILWDKEKGDGDATYMAGVVNESFDFVHASHVLEHLTFPCTGLQNWWRILKPGGFLLINVPHRDLYEKKLILPSSWNFDHKTFWLPERNEPPNTFGIIPLVKQEFPQAEIIKAEVVKEGWQYTPPQDHSIGEFSIELVLRKP